MKKTLIIIAIVFTAGFLVAAPAPGRGGYLGRRIILNGELAYSPYLSSVKDFFTRYNFQYGANLGIITGRRTQLNVSYNMWSLSGNELYHNFVARDRVKGYGIGLALRTFRKDRGGIAPIGKFFDIGLSYAQNKFIASSNNPEVVAGNANDLKLESGQVLVHFALGTQMVFKDRLVANTGLRLGTPIMEVSSNSNAQYSDFLLTRMRNKEVFSVFFGVGILL
ncbi:MAG: hypothetical protein M3R17_16555 [Bacteroidota bacterium]|nr:hypothetical protein [Bacteroidota bacterium]